MKRTRGSAGAGFGVLVYAIGHKAFTRVDQHRQTFVVAQSPKTSNFLDTFEENELWMPYLDFEKSQSPS